MASLFFPLKKSLVMPATERPNKGLIVFLPGIFGLTYQVLPRPAEQAMKVSLFVVDMQDTSWKYEVASFDITERGFPTGVVLNQADLDTYDSAYSVLAAQLEQDSVLLASVESEILAIEQAGGKAPEELAQQALDLRASITAGRIELKALGTRPVPVLEYSNNYSQVIDYFDKTGSITDDGIIWALNIPFMGGKLGDFV